MRIVFMGTPDFAIPSLKILLEHGYTIASVVTAPDKPQGRGQKVASPPVREFAQERDLPILQPQSLRAPEFVSAVASLQPDLIVVVAFRILPPEVFKIPRLGSFNLHASLLPKYRGAAPINWAIIRGEEETGVSTFLLQEKVDTGSILLQASVRIGADETAGELHDRLADLGSHVVLQTVRMIELGSSSPKYQDESLVSLAPKIFREDCSIDWRKPAAEIHNFVRGLSPNPCARTFHRGKVLRVYRTALVPDPGTAQNLPPGLIADVTTERAVVSTKSGFVALTVVQQEGRKRMGIGEFLRGYPLKVGDKLGK